MVAQFAAVAPALDDITISFNTTSHPPRVFILIILFLVSLLAVAFPEVSKRSRRLRIPRIVFFVGKHFGTGVILSTAFNHLLQEAFESLLDPLVNERYHHIGKWTGLIMLSGLLLIFLIEYISSTYVEHLYADHSAPASPTPSPSVSPARKRVPLPLVSHLETVVSDERTPLLVSPAVRRRRSTTALVPAPFQDALNPSLPRMSPNRTDSSHMPAHNEFSGLNRGCSFLIGSGTGSKPCSSQSKDLIDPGEAPTRDSDEESRTQIAPEDDAPKVGRRRQIVGLLVLQLGIMIHSAAIGLTLAVIRGSEFTSLATAIGFHQVFEGLSLGIRICSVPPPPGRPVGATTWITFVLPLLFALMTPLGMGIGLLLFSSQRSGDQTPMKLAQGLLSAISASMLIYAGTVEMLAGDFIFGSLQGEHEHEHGHSHSDSDSNDEKGPVTVKRQALAISSLLLGVIGMTLIGLGE
ncbi:Zinc/iron permease [Flagelloscypha sp. PMI_526]|nr:Zinc/iron permease [Flagelloscypha sp. PMI_526]